MCSVTVSYVHSKMHIEKWAFLVKIAKLWNELNTELKEETSPTQFKSLLKLVLMTKLYSDY